MNGTLSHSQRDWSLVLGRATTVDQLFELDSRGLTVPRRDSVSKDEWDALLRRRRAEAVRDLEPL
jgi:hypothetical protein